MRVGTLLEERCSLWGREVERMLDWSWLVVRLRKLDLPDLTSGVLFSEGRLNWSWACLDGVLFPWGAAGMGPTKSWLRGESNMGVLNWLPGNMFISVGIILSESSMSRGMVMPF